MRCSCDIPPTHDVLKKAMNTKVLQYRWNIRDRSQVKLACKAPLLPRVCNGRRKQPSVVQQQVTVAGSERQSISDRVSQQKVFLCSKRMIKTEPLYLESSNRFVNTVSDKIHFTQDWRLESLLLLGGLLLSSFLYCTQDCDAMPLFDESRSKIRAETVFIADQSGRQRALTIEQRMALEQMQSRPVGRTKSTRAGDRNRQVNDDVNSVERAVAIMKSAELAREEEDWASARDLYSQVITGYPDFALSERARIARALLEYQLGHVDVCIVELEDEEVAFRGSAEVHAALASVLYAERPERIALAEQQWDIATEFDTRYQDIDWVKQERKWPPKMLQALEAFLHLR